MEYFDDLGRIGVGTRLKRISDLLINDINALYRQQGIQLEASCFPLLAIVERYGLLSMREAEERLGTSHAAISQKASALKKAGLIEVKAFKGDHRIRKMSLTAEGAATIDKARPCWQAMDRALAHMFFPDENVFFRLLKTFEDRLEEQSFRHMTLEQMKAQAVESVKIVDFGIGMKHHFRSLNENWMNRGFHPAPGDEDMFDNPRQAVLDKGGDILFAEVEGEIVGTCALMPRAGALELVKIGIDPRFYGRGVGERLLEAAIERAKSKSGYDVLFLLCNTGMTAALDFYRRAGFRDVPVLPEDDAKYGRVDVRMELRLERREKDAAA